tara:strand:- start:212221 stop:212379 length:159 start_codon:yes stop_codon:yes gene_type:complete
MIHDHAPQTLSEFHYRTVPQELLNEAIAWLGRELGRVCVEKDVCSDELKKHF